MTPSRTLRALAVGAGLAATLLGATLARSSSGGADMTRFSLSVRVMRNDDRPPNAFEVPAKAVSRSTIILYGRAQSGRHGRGIRLTTFNDSIRYYGEAPIRFTALLSPDTLFATSKHGAGEITQTNEQSTFESMLECLFSGPALYIRYGGKGRLDKTNHAKASCTSGLYQQLDIERSLGIFFLRRTPADNVWHETRDIPSFSGFEYLSRLDLACRVLEREGDGFTVFMVSDSTVSGVQATLPSGGAVEIVSSRVHVESTIEYGKKGGFPVGGEVIISENIRYIRPELGSYVLEKDGTYQLKLTIVD